MQEKILDSKKEPLYLQLSNILNNKILSGEYKFGEKIPSELELVSQFQLSRVTVRKAIQDLTDKGIVEKKQGKGVFVKFPVYQETFSAGGSFTSSGISTNNIPTSVIINKRVIEKKIKQQYSSNFDSNEVLELSRIRNIDNQPVIYEIDVFDLSLKKMLDNLSDQDSLIDTLKDHGFKINHFDNLIDVILADNKIAKALNIEPNTSLLHIEQRVLDTYGKLIYFNEQFINSDIYKAAIRSY
ncbi:MAG: GntR family transcriptional regulator [Enterococcus faecalis]